MAKDPAFLFYSSDFLTGTMFMSHDQVGKFIRLLCAQHQKGHLQEKDMLNICGTHDIDIFSKFVQDADGLYYNVRCEEEITKRRNYSKSRSDNRKSDTSTKNISLSYVQHMENENENVIDNKDRNRNVFKKPELSEISQYCLDRSNKVDPEKFFNHYESNGWKVGKNKMKDWKAAVRTWEKTSFNKQETKPNAIDGTLDAYNQVLDKIEKGLI